ncbi:MULTISPECIES: histidine--tRNA ligase [unclassified Rathayibacter]|uniref:histidine--tRNA ligase n=1 Tax=unclassified Rathayibacter TaxID=2609250 RepID=UPI00188C117F|nr:MULTISPECIES: histidine--tRNA ligase [unclassified Rathayibacter]MBF4462792.1 histidine--tRNA ligase [Rathayibacter sp. VKM Ac-2879]MBF4504206.1 histidine--tRNA ligase [Rathayibacter sp. VKM Ac-2878]
MASSITPPRGMRDFLPADKAKREHALGVIRRVYAAHGFDEIETPVVEDFDRLHSGLGGDNEKLAFSVLRRGLSRDDLEAAAASDDASALADLGLRFDLTVPLARFYATHRSELPSVFRSVQVAPVWRAERPQRGRYRQFVQCDIDIIGEPGQLAEVELISATAAALDALGLHGCTIRINDRRILTGILEHCGFASERFGAALISIDKLDKIGASGVVAELEADGADAAAVLGGYLARIEEAVTAGGVALEESAILGVLPQGIDPEAVLALETLARSLRSLPESVSLRFDPTLVRGMGYYTGTIFEIAHPSSGSSVGGGGRYDGMIGRFLGQDVPACGFSIGFERVVELLEPAAVERAEAVVLVHERDAAPEALLALKQRLLADGVARVRLERRAKNLTPLLDRAAAAGYTRFALVPRDASGVTELAFKPLG